jgi:WD40 repeat protein
MPKGHNDLVKRKEEVILKGHSGILSLVIANDNTYVVSTGEDRTIRVWNL